MTLIETLSEQHRFLLELVGKLDRSIDAEDAPETRHTVRELQRAVVKHLVLEDQQLYPELVRAATRHGDRTSSQSARSFAAEMAQISSALLGFLVRWEHGLPQAVLAEQWPAVRTLLLDRIESEESTLYPMYTRLGTPVSTAG